MLNYFFRITALIFVSLTARAQNFTTRFEQSNGKESATYFETIDFYKKLDKQYATITIKEIGPTDVIYPLHVVYYSRDKNFDIDKWNQTGKLIILINNGIHPGEPDGIDASMMLMIDAAKGLIAVPDNIVLAIIPILNIGGALNRGSFSRANQNGPEAYGFRGSAQNLDLNRDFIKLDAKETQTLARLFHQLKPDIFIDNHVSNGADYQHVMTLLSVNAQKQGRYMGKYLENKFEPAIFQAMKRKGYDLVPYVNHWGDTPDKGWEQFYEPPRFASGFAALFGIYAFVPETHMLKPYKQRVAATYSLMQTFIEYGAAHTNEIKETKKMDSAYFQKLKQWVLDWETDTSLYTNINFKGYKGKYKKSEVSGMPRLYYDKNEPYSKTIPFYNKFRPAITATIPQAYIIPQGWNRITDRLQMNGVHLLRLETDTNLTLTVYRITDYSTVNRPYEGHYLHSKVQYKTAKETVKLLKGDFLVPTNQPAKRYLVETLEPNAPDAFFAWGFFDAVLQQKEHFSDYVFEDLAADLLGKDKQLKMLFEERKRSDSTFAKDGKAQLNFIYQHSPYYEPVHMRYPVFRLEAE